MFTFDESYINLEIFHTDTQVPKTQSTFEEPKKPNNGNTDTTNDRWVASLRRRDPEIQPTLPAISRSR